METQKPASRLPHFEFLRVLCMFGIVANHFFTYGLDIYGLHGEAFRVEIDGIPGTLLWATLEGIKLLSLVSVNCFILISGYFLIHTTEYRRKGIRRVWFQTWFYGVGIFLLMCVVGTADFSWLQLLKLSLPVITNQYWFITSYLALMIVAPFLSRLAATLDERMFRLLLLVGLFICFQYPFGKMFVDPQQLTLFVYLFLVGGYIRKFGLPLWLTTFRLRLAALLLFLAMFAITVVKNIMAGNSAFLIYAMEYHSLVMPLSILLFAFCARWTCPRPVASTLPHVAPYALAVYLIHSHPLFQDWLWHIIGRYSLSQPAALMPLLCLGCCLLIFFACIAIDRIRSLIIIC